MRHFFEFHQTGARSRQVFARLAASDPSGEILRSGRLAIGLWKPRFGLLVALCLIAYFVIAVGFHVRVRDTIANSFPPVLLAICSALVAATLR